MYGVAKTVRKMTADIDEAPAVWLRKEFSAEKRLRRATAYVSGLGFYELYLNGRKTDDCFFNTAIHDYGKSVPYLVHDVTDHIANGANTIGVVLGNGYFNPVIPSLLREYVNDFIDTPRLRCELVLEYDDGSRTLIPSGPTWRFTTDGPIRFNSLRSGEIHDARKELGNWSSCGFDDKNWKPALGAEAPAGRLVNQAIPPLRVIREIPPVSVKAHEGGWRFDLGVDNAGWARLKLRGKPGQKITAPPPTPPPGPPSRPA
jgi:alpha-L-rhamnosidase